MMDYTGQKVRGETGSSNYTTVSLRVTRVAEIRYFMKIVDLFNPKSYYAYLHTADYEEPSLYMLKKIFIVDDSEPLHQIYKVTVKRYKCETVAALRREDGLTKLADHPDVDLIIVDLNMPLSRMTALEFIRNVKAQEQYANIPIIAVTTRGKNYAQEALALSAGNLVKPFTSNELHSVIEKILPAVHTA
jgi:two-component system, chemotaxis family, chemotaxis protein CheY